MQTIYTPKGAAREYAELALNLYSGCPGRCRYCYVPLVKRMDRIEFHCAPRPLTERLPSIIEKVAKLRGKPNVPPIFLCFTSDPYPLCREESLFTGTIMEILRANDLHWTILTKFPSRAVPDFHLYRPDDSFGVTLTHLFPYARHIWEPGTETTGCRLNALKLAYKLGINTWASMEPILYPTQTLELIQDSLPYCNSYKLGALNHYRNPLPLAPSEWTNFLIQATELITISNRTYYIKSNLRKYLPRDTPYDTTKTA